MYSCIKIFTLHRGIGRVVREENPSVSQARGLCELLPTPVTLGFGAGGLYIFPIWKCAESVSFSSSEVIFWPSVT